MRIAAFSVPNQAEMTLGMTHTGEPISWSDFEKAVPTGSRLG
jgi:hypothetical protein